VSADKIAPKISGNKNREKVTPASPIGVFDSGVGGLTVLRQIMQKLPHEDVIYLADTARIPYGGRSPQEIIKINNEIIPFLIEQGAKLIMMACGTSSAIAYPEVKDKYPIEMINLIDPGSRAAVEATRSGKIGIMATAGTINSGAFQQAIKGLDEKAQAEAIACPLFVPLIEGGFIEADETKRVAKEYLKPLLAAGIDTLILGCTHYPHLRKVLQKLAGKEVVLVDPAEEAVADTKKLLKFAGTLKSRGGQPRYEYFVTGPELHFQDLGSRLLGKPIVSVKQVKLPG